jgi:hypothetical protein
MTVGGKFAHSFKPDCRQKEKSKPGTRADKSGLISHHQPGAASDREDNNRGNAPASTARAKARVADEYRHRRHQCQKEKNVI